MHMVWLFFEGTEWLLIGWTECNYHYHYLYSDRVMDRMWLFFSMDRGDYLRIDRVWLLVEKLSLTKVDKPNATVGGGIDKVWL